MNISYIEKIGKDKLHITLEDTDSFVLGVKEWNCFAVDGDKEISAEILSQLYENYFLPKAKLKALNLLKSRDHTRNELIHKLKNSGYPKAVIHKTLEYIDQYHYLNDQRFTENYIMSKGKKKSKKELLYELSMKGLDRDYIKQNEIFQETCDDRSVIRSLIEKRWGSNPEPDQKEKERMTRYLARRGFASDDIFSVYREKNI